MTTVPTSLAGSLLCIMVTVLAYEAGVRLRTICRGHALANPVLVAVVLVSVTLSALGIAPEDYGRGVGPLALLLGPATVALAVPLRRCGTRIRKALAAVVVTVLLGTLTATTAAVALARLFGISGIALHSMATKTATAAIAMAVAPEVAGDPALATGFAVLTGISGAVICTWVLDRAGVRDSRARGLAAGIAAHGIGTARMLSVDAEAGAFSGLAMGLTGLVVGVGLPLAYGWLNP